MNLVFLCKRRPQQRDLFHTPYGRFYHLPLDLARREDIRVTAILFDYATGDWQEKDEDNIHWISIGIRGNPYVWWPKLSRVVQEAQADWLLSFSDTWYGILGHHLAKRLGISLLIDAYDNYEAYMPWALPVHWLWRRALARADVLTAAGPQLLDRMCVRRAPVGAGIVPMAADDLFVPMDKLLCRSELGLAHGRKLVGYCGSAEANRGFEVFLEAGGELLRQRQDVDIVLTGRHKVQFPSPQNRVHQLGYVDAQTMPMVLGACDVLVASNKDSSFGQYSYPVKLYEAMACDRPIVASATEPARWILGENEQLLSRIGDAVDLREKIMTQLEAPCYDYGTRPSWQKSAEMFMDCLAD